MLIKIFRAYGSFICLRLVLDLLDRFCIQNVLLCPLSLCCTICYLTTSISNRPLRAEERLPVRTHRIVSEMDNLPEPEVNDKPRHRHKHKKDREREKHKEKKKV